MLVEDRLLVQYDNQNRQVLFCLDTSSGVERWRQERKTRISWASPALCRVGSRNAPRGLPQGRGFRNAPRGFPQQLAIVVNCKNVEAYDVQTGSQAWLVPVMSGEVAPSATSDQGIVYVACENACAAAIDAATGKVLWKNTNGVFPDVSSPVVIDGMFFFFGSGGTITCLDSATGKSLWEHDADEGFYSSPLVLGEQIVIFDMKGKMLVIQPNREKLIIAQQLELKEKVQTTPAIRDDWMWIRGASFLYGLRQQ